MTQKAYGGVGPRQYGGPAGVRLVAALEGAGADPFSAARAVEQGAAAGLTPAHTMTLLHRLVAGGWITRIKKGHYALNDRGTGLPRAHPFAIGTALAAPSAVSHWSALQHWGLTEQLSSTITISSPRRTFPPGGRAGLGAGRATWVVAGTGYEVFAIAEARFFGITRVWVSERDQVAVFDRERALLDAFHHFRVFGSLSIGLDILEAHLDEMDLARLAEYACRLRVTAVVKRIGWALERLGASPRALAPLREYPAKGESPLDPGLPARGRHNSAWHVIENLGHGE